MVTISFEVPEWVADMIKRAADINNMSVSDFVSMEASLRAARILERMKRDERN